MGPTGFYRTRVLTGKRTLSLTVHAATRTDVQTVDPGMQIIDLERTLYAHRVSGCPV